MTFLPWLTISALCGGYHDVFAPISSLILIPKWRLRDNLREYSLVQRMNKSKNG